MTANINILSLNPSECESNDMSGSFETVNFNLLQGKKLSGREIGGPEYK